MPTTKLISIKVPFALLAKIKQHAKDNGLTMTAFLLQSAIKEMEKHGN